MITLNLKPAVRLCDKDSQGIKINLDEWNHFTFETLLENIDYYFNGECDNLRDSEFDGTSWRLKFTHLHMERAVSIQEFFNNTHRPFKVIMPPQYQKN